jgi:hypothetical protein
MLGRNFAPKFQMVWPPTTIPHEIAKIKIRKK